MSTSCKKRWYALLVYIFCQGFIPARAGLSDQLANLIKEHPKMSSVLLGTLGIATLGAAGWTGYVAATPHKGQEIHWDWDNPNDPNTKGWQEAAQGTDFPKNWQWGTGSSAYQIEGNRGSGDRPVQNNWDIHQPKKGGVILPGKACDAWNKFKEDIQLAHDAGMTTHRFSISWEKVMTGPHQFDKEAIDHYVDVASECQKLGIKPLITLFHHTWPVWFDKLGGFEKADNTKHFVAFEKKMCDAFKAQGIQVDWLPLNEPAGYAMGAYVDGKYPPYQKVNFYRCGLWLKHILDAHVEFYHYVKKETPEAQVGIACAIVPLDPKSRYNPLDVAATTFVGKLLNNTELCYFTTGHFYWNATSWIPFMNVNGKNEEAKGALDFIGVNYYSHVVLQFPKPVKRTGVAESSNGKEIYPEGFHRALKHCWAYAQKLRKVKQGTPVPLIVTENGLCIDEDEHPSNLRSTYMKKHLHVVRKALQEGMDIRGYHWWSLTDHYNWGKGFENRYGIYKVDFTDPQLRRTMRPSAQPLLDRIQTWRAHYMPPAAS